MFGRMKERQKERKDNEQTEIKTKCVGWKKSKEWKKE